MNALLLLWYYRYAIPPEHGQRLERMARGRGSLLILICQALIFVAISKVSFQNVLRNVPAS